MNSQAFIKAGIEARLESAMSFPNAPTQPSDRRQK
jgi:hypothetical protein